MSINKLNINLLFLSLFFVYTQGFWERFTFLPVQYILEGFIILFILTGIRQIKSNPPGLLIFFLFSLFLIFSSFSTGTVVNAFRFYRFVFYTYFIYLIFWNKYFTIIGFNKLLRFIVFLVILQGFGSFYQSIIIGQKVEGYVGLMSSLGGTTATAFPLMIIAIVSVVYLLKNRYFKTKWTYYLVFIVISVLLVGYSSGKRSIYFTIPALIMILVLISKNYISYFRWQKIIFKMIAVFVLMIPLYFYALKNTIGIKYLLSGKESNIEILKTSVKYAKDYESIDYNSIASGRAGATTQILNKVFTNNNYLFFGIGYGSHDLDQTKKELNYLYGITGFTRDLLSGGIILAILTVFLFYIFIFKNKGINNTNGFFRLTRLSLLLVFIYVHFAYSSDFIVSLKMNMIFLILVCFLNSPKHHYLRENYSRYLTQKK